MVSVDAAINHELPPSQDQQPPHTVPIIESLTVEPRPPAVHPQQPPIDPQPPIEPTLPPEQIYYPQVPPQPQPQALPQSQPQPQPQPPRPITEMLGTGSFFFLQVRK